MYSMLTDNDATAVKLSLDIMKELYGRDVWKDTKTVNAISTACFSSITKASDFYELGRVSLFEVYGSYKKSKGFCSDFFLKAGKRGRNSCINDTSNKFKRANGYSGYNGCISNGTQLPGVKV